MILAIDPGVKGALAWGTDHGLRNVERMPGDMYYLHTILRDYRYEVNRIVVEDVGMAFGLGASAQSSYRFARHRGILEAMLYSAFPALSVEWVKPQVWQRIIIPRPAQTLADRIQNGKNEFDTKQAAFEYCRKRFLDFSIDKQCSDAVCLWAYATIATNDSKPTNTEV